MHLLFWNRLFETMLELFPFMLKIIDKFVAPVSLKPLDLESRNFTVMLTAMSCCAPPIFESSL